MKKIILLSLLLLTGCNDYELINTCQKTTRANTLLYDQLYEIDFKDNTINSIVITHNYLDEFENTITSLKQSLQSEQQFLIDNRQIIHENEKQITYEYIIDSNSDQNLKEYFMFDYKRLDYIRYLESEGFSCE